jgi:hypothetical protein
LGEGWPNNYANESVIVFFFLSGVIDWWFVKSSLEQLLLWTPQLWSLISWLPDRELVYVHNRGKVVGLIPVTATFACNPEQVALLRLLSSFEWDVKRRCQWQAKDPIQVRNMSSLWWTRPLWSKTESLGQ